jgi:integrase
MAQIDWRKRLRPGARITIERGLFAYQERTSGAINYGISYKASGKICKEIVADNLTDARARLAGRRAEVRSGKFRPKKSSPTFEEFSAEYLAHVKHSKRSWARDQLAVDKFREIAQPERLDGITTRMVARFKTQRAETCTPASVNRDLAVLKRMLTLAVEWDYLEENPAAKVRLFKLEEKPRRVLSDAEERRLVEAAAPHLKPILVVGVNTGLRRGERLALTWEQVDFEHNHVTVEHSKSKRVRHVPMNQKVRATLEDMRGISGPVFRYGPDGIGDFKTAFYGAVRRAGIPHCTPHSMRHTFATRLALRGVDLPTLQELLGHADITTTRKYTHPNPSHKQAAVDKLTDSQNQSSTQVAHGAVLDLWGNRLTR